MADEQSAEMMVHMDYPVRAVKTAAVAVAATLAAWWLFHSLYALIDSAMEADSARGPLAGLLHYLAANAAVLAFQPLTLWVGLRLVGVRGNHLAVVTSALVWCTMTAGHLLDSLPSPGEAFWWFSVQCAAATLPSLLQPQLMPVSTQPKKRPSKHDAT
ncbi:hypothetical protein [Streptomyces sp. NPDC102283]|uniref:hypothetical protein n=1 Tax=Streptomyces sp. NPDC102283 TaxID=3366155 RepID=UPI00380D8BC9